MKFFFIVFSMVVIFEIQASDLSFDDLNDPEKMAAVIDSPATLRGFLHRKDSMWILAAEPNVKSCCIANANQATKQIILEGDFSTLSQQTVVKIEGLLTYKQPFYHLQKASVVHSKNGSFPFITILAGFLTMGGGYLLFRRVRSTR